MKTYKYLGIMACTFFSQVVFSQSAQKNTTNPLFQLRQLLLLPKVGPPELIIHRVTGKPNTPTPVSFDIAKNIDEGKLECPLLESTPTLELDGERNNNEEVGLKWITTNGFDNLAFDVQRSFGDTMHFEKVNFVWAHERHGIKDKYFLPDDNNFNEVSYYRLKLQLNDGRFIYSNIAPVKGYNSFLFALYPNPASHFLRMNISSKEQGNAGITIYNAAGKMVLQQSSFIPKGFDLKEIDISKFSSGFYSVKLVLPDKQIRTGKFVKY